MIDAPSPNHDDRGGHPVDILLMHYTGMRSGAEAIARLRDAAAKVSAHYVVEEDGRVFHLVPEERRAWHAGVSSWQGADNINQRSIGIEIVNPGHEFGYRAFPAAQMQAVRDLALGIVARHAIPASRVIGHSDVAPKRKEDPGELFDWQGLAATGIGVWPVSKAPDWSDGAFFTHLERYGYDVGDEAAASRAFCRHFRQARIVDAPDAEMMALLNGLLLGIDMPMPRPNVSPGDPISAIETPALIVDLDAFEANLKTMADYAKGKGVRVRAHAKTHKCAEIGKRQMALGAVGVCCQKVSEAVALVEGCVTNVLVSNEVLHPAKLARLAALTAKARIGICVDSDLGLDRLLAAAAGAAQPIDAYVELEVGGNRCGVTSTADGVALAKRIAASNVLRFGGIHAYQGGAQHLRTPAERKAAIDVAIARSAELTAALTREGIEVPVVTGGGTGSFTNEAGSGVYGEIQPGSYIFMDRDYADNTADPSAPRFRHSLFVLTSVMSRRAEFAVIDAGLKAHSIDSGFPTVADRPGLAFDNPSDEHGIITGTDLPALGDTLRLIPGHCDPTVNLYDWIIAVRGDRVSEIWPIEARGAVT